MIHELIKAAVKAQAEQTVAGPVAEEMAQKAADSVVAQLVGAPAPKKRGRPKKKAPEEPIVPTPEAEDAVSAASADIDGFDDLDDPLAGLGD